jgi:hypothetical protein
MCDIIMVRIVLWSLPFWSMTLPPFLNGARIGKLQPRYECLQTGRSHFCQRNFHRVENKILLLLLAT